MIFHLFDNFFCKHICYITGFCDKKFNFCKFPIFFADSKSRAQELSNDVSFVIFGHQIWDLEGGGPSISWFSSTPAEIGLIAIEIKNFKTNIFLFLERKNGKVCNEKR